LEESFVAKIAHRLIKKHIAGNTMSSALKKAKQLNAKGLLTSITFLSDVPKNIAKSNYITATYLQLIRELSRLGLKANVHVPIEQLGSSLSSNNAIENAKKLIEFGNRYGIFLWFEGGEKELSTINKVAHEKGVGIAFKNAESALGYFKKERLSVLKVICSGKKGEAEREEKAVKELSGKAKVVMLAQNEAFAEKLIKSKGNGYKRSLIFEFQLGYSEKKMSKWLKRGASISVFIPFGRDWINYIINNMPSGYMQSIAKNLLAEKSEGNEKK